MQFSLWFVIKVLAVNVVMFIRIERYVLVL